MGRRATLLALLALAACDEPTTPAGVAPSDTPLAAAAAPALLPNTWTAVAPMPEALGRAQMTAGVATNAAGHSIAYVFGGRYVQNGEEPPATSILAYDATTDTWTKRAATYEGWEANGVGTIDGRLYISGGSTSDSVATSRLLAYDATADRMIRKAGMPQPTRDGTTTVINGKLYVVTGVCWQSACRRLYRYDPRTNVWRSLAPPPNHHFRGAAVAINGKLYVAGGGYKPFRSFDVYDPATNTWTGLSLLPAGREMPVGTAARSSIFVVGINYPDRTTFSYSPGTGKWTNVAPLPAPSDPSQLLSAPLAAVKVILGGQGYVLALGSIYFNGDGSKTPAPSYLYAP
jgi:N-acetylneuraminic acid mutarotase